MNTHHVSLYSQKTNRPDSNVLKQELITYEQTAYGLKVTRLERSFNDDSHLDSFTSSPVVLGSFPKYEGLLWGSLPKQEG